MRIKIKNYIQYINEHENQNYVSVYRGQSDEFSELSPNNSIWVTYDIDFAREYGSVKEYKMSSELNILDTEYYDEWEGLVDEFDTNGDYDEYKYSPTDEFISFLQTNGYDGFQNGDNILIFDKSVLK